MRCGPPFFIKYKENTKHAHATMTCRYVKIIAVVKAAIELRTWANALRWSKFLDVQFPVFGSNAEHWNQFANGAAPYLGGSTEVTAPNELTFRIHELPI